jgi:predicted transcriptional regulator
VDEHEEPLDVAALTTEIVVAYVSHHQIGIPDVPNVIKVVGSELASGHRSNRAREARAGRSRAPVCPTGSPGVLAVR